MKLWLLLPILMLGCASKNSDSLGNADISKPPASEEKVASGYVLLIGTYTQEYFADRLLLKAKNGSFSPIFKETKGEQHEVYLGPFESSSEADTAFERMKELEPKLPKPLLINRN